MATILKPVRLVNSGKSKRRLTARQKLFFGSKRQRAAAARTLGRKRTSNPPGKEGLKKFRLKYNRRVFKATKSENKAKVQYHKDTSYLRAAKRFNFDKSPSRLPNVGEIITIRPLVNSGTSIKRTKKRKRSVLTNMAKSAKRRAAGLKAARTRKRNKAARSHSARSSHRRRNPGVRRHRRRSNPSVRTVVRYRSRNAGVRRHRRARRNPGMGSIGGNFGKAVGIIGGALVTKIASGFLPASLTTGVLGYLSIGIVAMLQGKAIGKILKNPSLGNDMATGGYVYLALKIAGDYFPTLGLPFSLNGMGLIGGSSFYTPQVNQPGSMGQFVLPAAVAGAIPPAVVGGGMKGLGAGTSMRRVGRLR